jgi:hypothetical protein
MADLLHTSDAQKPANVPDKFWDAQTHTVRVDALLKSYGELERELSKRIDPSNKAKLNAAIGVPASPDDYQIDCSHGLFTPDANINAELHAADFTQPQAQKVYDLAAQHLVPAIMDVANQYQAEGELQRLQQEFGPGRWPEVAQQVKNWSSTNLPPDAARGLSTTYDGVMAMHKMMQDTGEQVPVTAPQGNDFAVRGEDEIGKLMRDPKYWHKKDPKHVAKVTAAFERKYGAQ